MNPLFETAIGDWLAGYEASLGARPSARNRGEAAPELLALPAVEPTCPECGDELERVDCERTYAVLRGDRERQEQIDQPFYCPTCMVGVEGSDCG